MFICKDREREVNQKDQGDRGVQEVRQESGFEAANSGVDDNCNASLISSNFS